jgi:hypothetical protein
MPAACAAFVHRLRSGGERQGMRFWRARGVAANDYRGMKRAITQQRFDHRLREPRIFIGDHAPGETAPLDSDEHFHDTREKARVVEFSFSVNR